MALTRKTRTTPRTPEKVARDAAIREKYQREKPSLDDLVATGRYSEPVPQEAVFTLMQLMKKLKQLRLNRRMSLADLSEISHVDRAALSRLENGHVPNPTFNSIATYAHALGARLRFVVEVDNVDTGTAAIS